MPEPRVTSNARLGFFIFSNPPNFCMCNVVSGDKAQISLLSPETKLYIQKCYICRDIGTQVAELKCSQWYSIGAADANRTLGSWLGSTVLASLESHAAMVAEVSCNLTPGTPLVRYYIVPDFWGPRCLQAGGPIQF
jgi:hypothetical protein